MDARSTSVNVNKSLCYDTHNAMFPGGGQFSNFAFNNLLPQTSNALNQSFESNGKTRQSIPGNGLQLFNSLNFLSNSSGQKK